MTTARRSGGTVLVVGATGLVGRDICRRLGAAGKPVRAMVRPTADAAKLAELERGGATLVHGDLKDRASVEAACRGVSAVITTASTTLSRQPDDSIRAVDLEGQLRLVDAAVAAGVSRFVYLSFSHQITVDSPLTQAKRSVERHLEQSGLTYTVLAPSMFMEVWLAPALGFDMVKGTARIFGTGKNPISWIALGDVAQFAVASLEHPDTRDATLELGGPEALAPLDVVRICETVNGRPFAVQHVPEDALRAQQAAATDPYQQTFAALMLAYAGGNPIDMRATLAKFPVPLVSVEQFVRRTLAG